MIGILLGGFIFTPGCVPPSALIVTPASPTTAGHAPVVTASRARYQFLVARMELASGDLPAAKAALDVAALHDPGSAWIALARADCAAAEQDQAGELAHARAAVTLAPSLGAASGRVGHILAAAGDRQAAEASLRAAIAQGADDGAWALLVHLLLARAAPDAGAVVARWAMRPLDDGAALRERGEARARTGDDAGAVDDLGLALDSGPDDARLLDEYVTSARRAKRFRTALVRLESLHRLLPASEDVVLRAWHLAREAEDPVRGEAALAALDSLQGGRDAQVAVWLAEQRSDQGDVAGAFRALDLAARRTPPAGDIAVHRARVLAKAGRVNEALGTLRIPKNGPLRTEAIALQAQLLLALGRTAEARRVVESALIPLPDSVTLLLAEVRVCTADHDAVAALAAVNRLPMNATEQAVERARVLAGTGDGTAALAMLSDAPSAAGWALEWSIRRELGMEPVDAAGRLMLANRQLARAPGHPDATLMLVDATRTQGAAVPRELLGLVRGAVDRSPADDRLLDALARLELEGGEALRAAAIWQEALRYGPLMKRYAEQRDAAYALVVGAN